jgi:hypothetical protein
MMRAGPRGDASRSAIAASRTLGAAAIISRVGFATDAVARACTCVVASACDNESNSRLMSAMNRRIDPVAE